MYRRFVAHCRYLKRPLIGFLPLLLGTTALVIVGGICFQKLYHQQELTFGKATYITYCLIFMEHIYEYPDDLVLRFFYWVLPPIGLVVILDGVVRFSYHVTKRDETSGEWVQAMTKSYRNHVVLVGLGKVGVRVLEQLLHLRQDVVILEKDEHCSNISFAHKHDVPVLVGSGREEGITDKLNVATAKSIILATDDDLANLEMALDARKCNSDIRVVLRMFDQDLASKVCGSFDISVALSTSSIAAPLFATSSSDRSIVNAFYVNDRLLVVANIEVRPDSELAGREVRDLRVQDHIFIVSLVRGNESNFYPDGDIVLTVGDHITVQTEPDTLRRVHEWNHDPEPY